MTDAPPPPPAALEPQDLEDIRLNFLDERSSRWMYLALAARDRDPGRRTVLEELARYEDRHSGLWEALLLRSGAPLPPERRFLEHRIMVLIGRLFGVAAVLPLLHKSEVDGIAKYRLQAERWRHPEAARTIREILPEEVVHEVDLFEAARKLHAAGGALRSAILGANDGLGSILALAAGVAGATNSSQAVVVAGLAGLVAGAASMAASNYTSVKAEREVYESLLRLQQEAVEVAPRIKREQLEAAYRRRGLAEGEARAVVERAAQEPGRLARALLAEESGITGASFESPGALAAVTGLAFLAAGTVPVLPFFLLPAPQAVLASVAASGAALFLSGLLRSLSTLKPFLRSGLEMILIGLSSAAVTYLVGRLVGVVLD